MRSRFPQLAGRKGRVCDWTVASRKARLPGKPSERLSISRSNLPLVAQMCPDLGLQTSPYVASVLCDHPVSMIFMLILTTIILLERESLRICRASI